VLAIRASGAQARPQMLAPERMDGWIARCLKAPAQIPWITLLEPSTAAGVFLALNTRVKA
jgi:hypothetical protein